MTYKNIDEFYKTSIARIYTSYDDQVIVIGAGLLVSSQYIVTCAHVVVHALKPPDETQDKPIGLVKLDFPFSVEEKNKEKFQAEVIVWKPQSSPVYSYGEDIAVLQLKEKLPAYSGSDQLSLAYTQKNFSVLGFPEGRDAGIITEGKLLGTLGNGLVQMVVEGNADFYIEPGFSGAPVWNGKLASFVGIVRASELDQEGRPLGGIRTNVKAAYMIPTEMLFDACNVVLNPIKSLTFSPFRSAMFYSSFCENSLNVRVYGIEVFVKLKPTTFWDTLMLLSTAEVELNIDGKVTTIQVIWGKCRINSHIENKPIKLTANLGWWRTTYELEVDGYILRINDIICELEVNNNTYNLKLGGEKNIKLNAVNSNSLEMLRIKKKLIRIAQKIIFFGQRIIKASSIRIRKLVKVIFKSKL